MRETTPNYYKTFRCIADKCKHNCCIGWEIDIDEKTLAFYKGLDTPLGKRIRASIEGDVAHFILSDNDRCPFLNESNLCDIITECGEKAVCEICRLHPRFRNFYSDFFETGLGLCCEEAARIILTQTEKFDISVPDNVILTQQEKEHFEIRGTIFSILQKRSESINTRFEKLCYMFGLDYGFNLAELCNTYLSLERLDEGWTGELIALKDFTFDGSIFEKEDFSVAFEQLAVYFIFRHIADAIECCDYSERVRFTVMSCYLIGALWQYHNVEKDSEKMIDITRMYSSEIEYSEDNTATLLWE